MTLRSAFQRIGLPLFLALAAAVGPCSASAADVRLEFEGDVGCIFGVGGQTCSSPVVATPGGLGPFARIAQKARVVLPSSGSASLHLYSARLLTPSGSEERLVACAASAGGQLGAQILPLPYRGNGRYQLSVAAWTVLAPSSGAVAPGDCPDPSDADASVFTAAYTMNAQPPTPQLRGRLLTHGPADARMTSVRLSADQDTLNRYETTAEALPGNPTSAGATPTYNKNIVMFSAPGRYALRQRAIGYPRPNEIGAIDNPGPWGAPTVVTIQSQFELETAQATKGPRGQLRLSWALRTPEIGAEPVEVQLGTCGKRRRCRPAELKELRRLPRATFTTERRLSIDLPALRKSTTYGVRLTYRGRAWVPASTITQMFRVRASSPRSRSSLTIAPLSRSNFALAAGT